MSKREKKYGTKDKNEPEMVSTKEGRKHRMKVGSQEWLQQLIFDLQNVDTAGREALYEGKRLNWKKAYATQASKTRKLIDELTALQEELPKGGDVQ